MELNKSYVFETLKELHREADATVFAYFRSVGKIRRNLNGKRLSVGHGVINERRIIAP